MLLRIFYLLLLGGRFSPRPVRVLELQQIVEQRLDCLLNYVAQLQLASAVGHQVNVFAYPRLFLRLERSQHGVCDVRFIGGAVIGQRNGAVDQLIHFFLEPVGRAFCDAGFNGIAALDDGVEQLLAQRLVGDVAVDLGAYVFVGHRQDSVHAFSQHCTGRQPEHEAVGPAAVFASLQVRESHHRKFIRLRPEALAPPRGTVDARSAEVQEKRQQAALGQFDEAQVVAAEADDVPVVEHGRSDECHPDFRAGTGDGGQHLGIERAIRKKLVGQLDAIDAGAGHVGLAVVFQHLRLRHVQTKAARQVAEQHFVVRLLGFADFFDVIGGAGSRIQEHAETAVVGGRLDAVHAAQVQAGVAVGEQALLRSKEWGQ
ncbi:hypothetical protein [Xylophilus sp. GOD-11R]|uniref:hypothetical protein n=1 Tax=Xylophilus sp. GOD-11R TaxID=3089814 RepID=UPI00298BF08B|nr:hypothetical protein [Xylophilus sp. GOD-11R]WPB57201.1 hypothetical protein R9X41_00640 [Xylophilus sp. GOD-11R]